MGKSAVVWVVALSVLAIAGSVLYAEWSGRPSVGLATHSGGESVVGVLPNELPPVESRQVSAAQVGDDRDVYHWQYDDGTCESGLGVVGGTWSSLVNWNIPCNCVGIYVMRLTVKANSGTMQSVVMYQSGDAPGNRPIVAPIPGGPIVGSGPCPSAQTMQTRVVPSSTFIADNSNNFFFGLRGNAYLGRDTDGVSAGAGWLCQSNAATCFSPTYLAGLNLSGNWMLRITIWDPFIPVELQSFGIE